MKQKLSEEKRRRWERERKRRWRARNPERLALLAASADWRRRVNAAKRRWRARNRAHIRQYNTGWWAANTDKSLTYATQRRARIAGAPIIERIDRLAIYARDGGRCHLCRRSVSERTFTLDHLVPLAKGGEHAAFNLAVAHGSCNGRKHAKRIPVQVPLALTFRAVA